jgi:hypothetical protein
LFLQILMSFLSGARRQRTRPNYEKNGITKTGNCTINKIILGIMRQR